MKAQPLKKLEASGKSKNVYTLSTAERRRWINAGGKPVWTNWVQAMERKGYKNAQAILDATMEMLQ
jgi:hypothetical protein